MSLFQELNRRNVFRVAAAYAVAAWLVIQVAETIFPLFGFGDAPARIVVLVLAIGFVPVLVIAWAFEITPEGLKREADVDRESSITPQTAKKLDRITIAVLAVALAYFAFDKFVLDPQRDIDMTESAARAGAEQAREEARLDMSSDKSIAVLPFVSMTEDPADEFFADGLTEELSHVLARMGDLEVTGRTSSFYFKGRNEDLRVIGETLGVAQVLEGSVRRSGKQLRITAQLINTENGFHLWSESYDREMSDVIEIQKDIAQNVAVKLHASMLDDSPANGLSDIAIGPEAYALYLEAVSLSPYGKGRGLGEAQELVEKVTELAPDFAPGWNRLAAIHGRRLIFGDPDYPATPKEALGIMDDAISKALSLDPYSGEAHANLAGFAWIFEGNAAKAAPLIEHALELDPWNLELVSFAADFAKRIGRLDEALELEELLLSRDPLCEICRFNLARSYLFAGRYDAAEQQYRTMQSRGGGFHWSLGVVLLAKQQPEQALASFERHTDFPHLTLQGRAMALHDLGRVDEAQTALDELESEWGNEYPMETAQAFAWVGELDKAFEWLERSLPEGTTDLQTSFPHPIFDAFRDDPRWQAVMMRIGRTPEQMEKIPFSLDVARDRLGI